MLLVADRCFLYKAFSDPITVFLIRRDFFFSWALRQNIFDAQKKELFGYCAFCSTTYLKWIVK